MLSFNRRPVVALMMKNTARRVPRSSTIYFLLIVIVCPHQINEDLSSAKVVFGVKQVPIDNLLPERTYVFFSHVIKGQPANMPMLQAIQDKRIRLIDYECITTTGVRSGPRMIAFGNFAGKAGMIDLFRGLGERLIAMDPGYNTPFVNMGSAFMYPSYEKAIDAVEHMGKAIAQYGVPKDLAPFTIIFTGNGNVSTGAQEVFRHLPHVMVKPEDLPFLPPNRHVLYGCVVEEEFMVRKTISDGKPLDRKEYYAHPERFSPIFHELVLPHARAIMNCTYWDGRYPRLVTKQQLKELTLAGKSKLLAIGDVSCDIHGSMEFLSKSTDIEKPFFMYDPLADTTSDSLDMKDGVVMCGVRGWILLRIFYDTWTA